MARASSFAVPADAVASALQRQRDRQPVPTLALQREPVESQPVLLGRTWKRFRPGLYSSTVSQLVFSHGPQLRTDLIRLNPGISAYSLNPSGTFPEHNSQYQASELAGSELVALKRHHREISWILNHSYPAVGLEMLTDRLQRAGLIESPPQLREHEAIAATQAAIWYFTHGWELDTRPNDLPVRQVFAVADIAGHVSQKNRTGTRAVTPPTLISRYSDAQHLSLDADSGITPALFTVDQDQVLTAALGFDHSPQLRGYSLRFGEGTSAGSYQVWLERSRDGNRWQPVSSSASKVTITRPVGSKGLDVQRRLAPAATLADAHAPVLERGYPNYRIVVQPTSGVLPVVSEGTRELRVDQIDLRISGPRFANPERVIALYRQLITGASEATDITPTLSIHGPMEGSLPTPDSGGATRTTVNDDAGNVRLLGPYRVEGVHRARVNAIGPAPLRLLDSDLREPIRPLRAGDTFHIELPQAADTGSVRVFIDYSFPGDHAARLLTDRSSEAPNAGSTTLVALEPETTSHRSAFTVRLQEAAGTLGSRKMSANGAT